MSCTVGALPFLLLYGAIAASTGGISSMNTSFGSSGLDKENLKEKIKETIMNNNGEVTQEQIEEICKEYQTVFLDRDVLIKTLEEYGFSDFVIKDDKLSCSLEQFHVDFFRNDSALPYTMKVTTKQDCPESHIISDITSEYALNVQEENYIKIKERLSKKNLKIDYEEVLEDDSIMITVNLD